MRPEDVLVPRTDGGSKAVPIDAALEALDAELNAAGAQARRMLNGKLQPTRFFALKLRGELLDTLSEASATGTGADPSFGKVQLISRR